MAKRTKKKSPAQLDREIAEVVGEPSAPRRWNVGQEADPRAGFYYVTAIDNNRSARIAGPYRTHEAALDAVDRVKNLAYDVDPRAHWWAWGTMRSETDLGPGALGVKP